jgi:DNA helicase-2/ATP-dependent DNA helicase PcrA
MLDPDQQEAATSDPRRPLLILAHAGTGKTRTLIERLTLLGQARRAGLFGERSGGAIAVVTFTRAAMHELRNRLAARIGDAASAGYDVRTFHSLSFALYRDGWARAYDNRPRVRVATRAQAQQAATDAVRAVGLNLTPHQAIRLIADAKLGLPLRTGDPALAAAALAAHDELLARRDLLHIHDLLVRPVRLLAQIPVLQREVRTRYACVVGDEAQDWSPYQAALFAYLAGPEGYATACGDVRQAIYGGSSPRLLLEFPTVYPHARVVTLHTTYRLTGPLLNLSRAIAAYLPGGAIIGLCQRPDGPLPLVHIAQTRTGEAAWIAAYLRDLHARGLLDAWTDAVVLVRTRTQRTRLADALRDAGLPVRAGTQALAGRPAIGALLAWLSLLRDPDDSTALLRVLDAPLRGRQHTPPRSLRLALAPTGPWTMDRLRRELPPGLSDRQRRELATFVRLYQGLHVVAETAEPVVLIDAVLERTGLATWLQPETAEAAGDIAALRALVEQEADIGALDHVLAEEPSDEAGDAVAVHTIHGFKGREARAVVAGVEEGLLPHPAVLRDGHAGLEAELRTFYVACTRALEHEALTAAWEPDPDQGAGGPSRLFHLIDPTLVKVA